MMMVRLTVAIVTLGLAFWLLYKSQKANFKPYAYVRISLWLAGFALGYSILWLMIGDAFLDNIVTKLLIGFVSGLVWAFQAASTIEAAYKRTEKFNGPTK